MTRRPIIGVVGQICAGKSAVAEAFRRHGAWIYDADRQVHELYRDPEVKREISERFGEAVFDDQGEVDRRALGSLVFADRERLKILTNEIIFPRTRKALKETIAHFRRREDRRPALIVDAPTLLEAGHADLCDVLLFVAAPDYRRAAWARQNRGWSEEELKRREGHLLDEVEKRSRCDAVVENNATEEALERRVTELWRQWVTP